MKKTIEDRLFATGRVDLSVFPMRFFSGTDKTTEELVDTELTLLWFAEDGEFSYQACISDKYPCLTNNFYFIYLFKDGNLVAWSVFPSKTVDPPVWDRHMGGVSYYDYLLIQEKIHKLFNGEKFPVDYSADKKDNTPFKSFFFKAEDGNNLAIFADKNQELVQRAIERIKLEPDIAFYPAPNDYV